VPRGVLKSRNQEALLRGVGSVLEHDGQGALGLVEHVAQVLQPVGALLAQLGEQVALGDAADPQLPAADPAVLDEHPDTVVSELGDNGAVPGGAYQPVRGQDGKQRHHPEQQRLGAGDRGPPDDRTDRNRGGEVDRGPLGQRAPVGQPQPHQGGEVHQGCFGGDRTQVRPVAG
jgi:hypothetical protein